jgi:hypothetical protein
MHGNTELKWNGCWEIRLDRIICRWMIVWLLIEDRVLGCVAGYSGGGAFQLEKFQLTELKLLIEAEEDFSVELVNADINLVEDCQDLVMAFHDQGIWFENENLVLNKEKIELMRKSSDLLFGGAEMPKKFDAVFNAVGLISK